MAAEPHNVESQPQKKVFLTKSEDVDHEQCTASEKRKKQHEYQPTTLWQFIEVLADESQSNSIQVSFTQCKKHASCSKQRLQDQCSPPSTVHEVQPERTEGGNNSSFTPSTEMQKAQQKKKKKKKNEKLQPLESSNSSEDMLLIKVTFFCMFLCVFCMFSSSNYYQKFAFGIRPHL